MNVMLRDLARLYQSGPVDPARDELRSSGVINFTDTFATNFPYRFYRAVFMNPLGENLLQRTFW